MDIRADEITKIIREQLGGFSAGVDVSEVGTVLSVGDGIARLHGLERCMAGELLEFPGGVSGIALNLERPFRIGGDIVAQRKGLHEGSRAISVAVRALAEHDLFQVHAVLRERSGFIGADDAHRS